MDFAATSNLILFQGNWPWWLGSLGLATVAIGFCWIVKRPLGVSGFLRRVLFWSRNRAREVEREELFSKQAEMQAALKKATEEQLAALPEEQRKEVEAAMQASTPSAPQNPDDTPDWCVQSSFIYLVGITLGGLLSAWLQGTLKLQTLPIGAFREYFSSPILSCSVLFIGGILVGFGTAMCGGCTSGHGLSGNARFQTGSHIATAMFFGTAIGTAFLLKAVL